MKFLILLFASCAFASLTDTYTFSTVYSKTGDHVQCFDDYENIRVMLYAGNSFISSTLLPDCYSITVGIFDAIITGENTKLMIQDGKITSMVTNGMITDYSESTPATYNSEIIFHYELTVVDGFAIIMIIVLVVIGVYLLFGGAFCLAIAICICREDDPEAKPLI
jgi:hypothetical protein